MRRTNLAAPAGDRVEQLTTYNSIFCTRTDCGGHWIRSNIVWILELGATVADSRATSDGAVMNQATILRTLTSYY